jgi:hypothetical protein
MLIAISHNQVLATEICCNCHIAFAMPKELQDRRRTEGGTFYCPNGHGQHYAKTENQKLREQLDRANSDSQYWRQRKVDADAQKEATERRLSAQKGQVTKLKRRITNGVCPCCSRSFSNLRRHMSSQHPDFTHE